MPPTTTQLLPQGRCFLQKIATLATAAGTLKAAIIGPTPWQTAEGGVLLQLWDDKGRTAQWPIDVSNNTAEAVCVLLPGRLIVAWRGSDFRTIISEFLLPNDPMANAPTKAIADFAFGDNQCRGNQLLVLPSGDVVCLTYVHAAVAVHGAHRAATTGNWKYDGYFTIPTRNPHPDAAAHQFAAAVCPWSGQVASFTWTDGEFGIDVGFFAIVNGKLALVNSLPAWLNRELKVNGGPTDFVQGAMAPNGELPSLWAITDTANQRVLLSYTNGFGQPMQSSDPAITRTQNGAHPVVTAMGADLVPRLIAQAPAIIVSVLNPIPLMPGAMLYWTGYPLAGYEVMGDAGLLAVGTGANPQAAVDPLAHTWIYQQPGGTVAMVALDGLVPLPEPLPTPATLVASNMVGFSWSGADPTGGVSGTPGKYMLQVGASANGPWQNISDHWPVNVATSGTMSGALIQVEGKFYRLVGRS